jgi:hypothetical protein
MNAKYNNIKIRVLIPRGYLVLLKNADHIPALLFKA